MANPRYVTDYKTSSNLLFPDLLRIHISGEDVQGIETLLTLECKMTIDPNWKIQVGSAREIVVDQPYFILRRPSTNLISDFYFVVTGPLQAQVTLGFKTA